LDKDDLLIGCFFVIDFERGFKGVVKREIFLNGAVNYSLLELYSRPFVLLCDMAKKQINSQDILSAYMQHILEHGAQPKNVYVFAK
jgi:hypothetical protein